MKESSEIPTSSTSNKRIAKNTMMLYIRMLLTMAVSLYTSRVVLNVLGVEDYGTYNVVGGVVTMFGFFNGAMASATQRFLSFELGRGDYDRLRKTFNATQFIHIGVALLVLLLVETAGIWFINNYLNIPEGRMAAAQWVFHFAVLSFMLSIIQVPYNALIIAREKMSVYAYVSILDVVLKLLIVFLLSWLTFDKLKLYAVLQFSVTLIIIAIYRIYVLKKFEESRFEMVKDKAMYQTLMSYSGWTLFGAFSMVARGQGVSILLNMFFGTVVNAAQGVANQVHASIYSFVSNFQLASNPQIVKSYAANEKTYMSNLIIRTSKFSFYLLFILTLPVLLEMDYILKIWLKIVPEYTAVFAMLILVNAWIDSFSGPLITAVNATGKIKHYQIIVGILFTLNLPITYLLFKIGYSPVSAFLVNICITAVVFIVRLLFVKKQIPEFPTLLFLREISIRNIPVVLIAAIIPWLIKLNYETGFMRFSLIAFFSIISSVAVIYIIGLSKSEKLFLNNYLSNALAKLKVKMK